MMVDFRKLLTWLNVDSANVHFECFGPAVADIDAASAPPASYWALYKLWWIDDYIDKQINRTMTKSNF